MKQKEFLIYTMLILILLIAFFLDTGKTCREIGALNKQKEKIKNSLILKEYTREYKRMHGLHYNHSKIFKEKQFKEWSEKARKLRNSYNDEYIEILKQN